jgi:putative membrane protein
MVISKEDLSRIEKAVEQADSRTIGEIVPVIALRSDSYSGAVWRFAALFAILCEALIYHFLSLYPLTAFMLQIPALGLAFLLAQWAPLRRHLISHLEAARAFHHRSFQAFHEHGLHRTEGETGVLIFVSLLERKACILADRAILEKLHPKDWEALLHRLFEKLREGKLADGLIEAIGSVGEKLTEHFPASGEHKNQLPNRVSVED